MRTLLSIVLYHVGDALSYLLKVKWMTSIIYPVYNRVMLTSAGLDVDGKLWSHRTGYLTDLKVKLVEGSYRPYLDKYKYNKQLLNRKINKTK